MFAGLVPAMAATFTINSTADTVDANPGNGTCETAPGNGICTLRAAIQEANALTEASTIDVPAGTYVLTQSTTCAFHVSPAPYNIEYFQTTSLCLSRNITLIGAGADTTVIDGNHLSNDIGFAAPVMFVSFGATVEISGVTMKRGNFSVGSLFGTGGGIRNSGTLTLADCVLSENFTGGGGGGAVYNTGDLTVIRSTLTRNETPRAGGAIANFANPGYAGGIVKVSDSVISSNYGADGGGISNISGTVIITGSTISDNFAVQAGGISNSNGSFNTMTLTNVTVSGNRANQAGGILNSSTMHLNNVTITNNTAQWSSDPNRGIGGGLLGVVTLQNTLIAGNFAAGNFGFPPGPDCYTGGGALTSQGYNLIQNTNGCTIFGDTTGNITGQDPKLGLLTDNGGRTPTHALADSSPAIDAGNPAKPGSGGAACAALDQLGFLRPLGVRCDIGAFERRGGFSVTRVLPSSGGNTGSMSALIVGSGFASGASVTLRRAGEPDIVGAPLQVDIGGSAIGVTLDLTGKAVGQWDVIVTNPGGSSQTLADGFTVQAGGTPDLWADIVGFIRRPGRPSTLTIVYGNRGNVDALAVPLSISTSGGYGLTALFRIAQPPPQPDQRLTDFSQVPVTVQADAQDSYTNVPLLLPVVPAGFTGTLQIVLRLPPDAAASTLFVSIDTPYFSPTLKPKVVSSLVLGAVAYAQQGFHVAIPSALIPDLEQYVRNQLQLVVDNGRAAFVASLGETQQVYSLSQLQIDVAIVGAVRALH